MASADNPANLAEGFNLRALQWADVEPVAQLMRDVLAQDGDEVLAASPHDLRVEWQSPDFDLARDAWVVTDQHGRVVGFESFQNNRAHALLEGDGYVHPDFMGLGIGTTLLRALEVRAREEIPHAAPDLRVVIRNILATTPSDAVAREMHENEGYRPVRYHWRMQIQLAGSPPPPVWPVGVELRPFLAGPHNPSVYEAEQEAFLDHWGSHHSSFDAWRHHKQLRDGFDPALWHVAWAGDEVAGFSQCRWRQGIGWVSTLGVRRPWRKQGLGLALLLHSFGDFHRRGMNTIGLGVDASNPTGATRLYKKAGMDVAAEYVTYEKELRPGRDLDEEA